MAVSLSHRCLMEFLQKSDSGVTVSHQPRVCCAVRQPPTRGQEPPVSPSCKSVAARGRAEVCGTRVCARVCTRGLPAPLSVPASQPTFITGHPDISFISSILHIPRSEFLLLFFTKRRAYVFSPLSIAVFLRPYEEVCLARLVPWPASPSVGPSVGPSPSASHGAHQCAGDNIVFV